MRGRSPPVLPARLCVLLRDAASAHRPLALHSANHVRAYFRFHIWTARREGPRREVSVRKIGHGNSDAPDGHGHSSHILPTEEDGPWQEQLHRFMSQLRTGLAYFHVQVRLRVATVTSA